MSYLRSHSFVRKPLIFPVVQNGANSGGFSVCSLLVEFEYCLRTCVDCFAHALGNVIHVDFCGRLDVFVSQDGLRVFHHSVLLQVTEPTR